MLSSQETTTQNNQKMSKYTMKKSTS